MTQTPVSNELIKPTASDELAQLRAEVKALREAVAAMTRIESEPPQPDVPTDYPHIVRREGVCGGQPRIRGTRMRVSAIVEMIRAGVSPEKIVEEYQGALPLPGIYDALAYYHAHPQEIEGYIAADEQAGEEVSYISAERTARLREATT